jgi:hypothetical protein
MSDHGATGDIGKRLAREPARAKPGGDENDDVVFHRFIALCGA